MAENRLRQPRLHQLPLCFDDKPPYVPNEQPVAVYRKKFEVDGNAGSYIIAFLGVVPCIDLYINGEFVGYGEGAHNTSEFDITKYLKRAKTSFSP